jgi:hypothetical protein
MAKRGGRSEGDGGAIYNLCVRNGQKEILRDVSNLERTRVERYREVSVYTAVY